MSVMRIFRRKRKYFPPGRVLRYGIWSFAPLRRGSNSLRWEDGEYFMEEMDERFGVQCSLYRRYKFGWC